MRLLALACVFLQLLLPSSGAAAQPTSVELWGLAELVFTGPAIVTNPFEVEMNAVFTEQDTAVNFGPVAGFFDGGTSYKVRFSPPARQSNGAPGYGLWCWRTHSNEPLLDGKRGCLTVTAPGPDNHGPVQTRTRALGLY